MKFVLESITVQKSNQRPSIQLSSQLETLFFAKVLKQVEIESLKNRCDHYQLEKFHRWKPSLFLPYSQYFGFLAALKAKAALTELYQYKYLDLTLKAPIKIIDIGAGTLGATIGALDFLKEKNHTISEISAIDQEMEPVQWASQYFNSWIKTPIAARTSIDFSLPLSHTLVICSDVLNEAKVPVTSLEDLKSHPLGRALITAFEKADETTIFLFIEPASKDINQNLLRFRNLLSEKLNILLPCTHQLTCPALIQDEWCHEDRDYKAPSVFWNFVHKLGFERRKLQFSLLALGKQPTRFTSDHVRVVSRQLKNKGRCDKWLCGAGKRWKASLLTRHEGPDNQLYFDSSRGDILDPSLTIIPRDGPSSR